MRANGRLALAQYHGSGMSQHGLFQRPTFFISFCSFPQPGGGGGLVHTLTLEQIGDDAIRCKFNPFSILIALSSSFLRRIASVAGLSASNLCTKGFYVGVGCVGGVYSSLLYGVHQLRGGIPILGLKNLVSKK